MDHQDRAKNTLSGHESHGVYVCHNCGWPFPNPHPSARHRRAHKKICGTIEGYKLITTEGHVHWNDSDDEQHQHSDEDRKTPSPKFEKRSIGGGIGDMSNKSVEDELFSDAVTEFSDSGFSPGTEVHLEGVTESDKNVGKTVEADPDAGQLLKIDGIADIIKPLDSPLKSSQEPKAIETAPTEPLKETRAEELGMPISRFNGSPIKSERKENIKENEEDDSDKMSTTAAKPPSKTVNEASEAELQDIDVSVQEQSEISKPEVESIELIETNSIKTVQFNADSAEDIKGEENEDFHVLSVANDFPVVDQPEILIQDFKDHKEVKSNMMSLHDLPPEADSVEQVGASFDNVQIKSDSAPRVCTDTESVEVSDTKGEEKADLHALSSANLHVVDQPEIMIEDFKDHKAVKSDLSLTGGSAEVIKTAEVGDEDAVCDEQLSSSHSSNQHTTIQSSSSDTNTVEDMLKQESDKNNLTTEKPVEKEDDASELKVTHGEDLGLNGLGASPDSSDVVPMVTSVDESREGDTEISAQVESEDSLCVSKVDQISNSTGEYVGKSTRTESESTGGETGKENFATNTETKLDSASQLSELPSIDSIPDSTKVEFDSSDLGSMAQTDSGSPECPDDDSREVTKETKSGIGAVATGSESNRTIDAEVVKNISMKPVLEEPMTLPIDSGSTDHITDVEVSERNSDKPVFEEPGPFLVDSGLETKTLGIVEDSSGVCSKPKQDEGDDKILKQQTGASGVDISVDSISQTDSLEGNWGSVSVLSIQSDAPANIDGEALPSKDSHAPTKSEEDNFQKPKTGLEGSHSNKQEEAFEPPSYTTLVESEGCVVEPKTTDSKIDPLQTNQQPSTEALQSGWFPSLTNVVNESQGRKKNEEIIAKVTNWSAGVEKQHNNLKNLLSEANAETKPKAPSPKPAPSVVSQKDDNVPDTKATPVKCAEASVDHVVKKETAKEWNSPARYPTEIKKEKRKAKGKPTWVPFICCSSVN